MTLPHAILAIIIHFAFFDNRLYDFRPNATLFFFFGHNLITKIRL